MPSRLRLLEINKFRSLSNRFDPSRRVSSRTELTARNSFPLSSGLKPKLSNKEVRKSLSNNRLNSLQLKDTFVTSTLPT
jgi:hypothetical protein